jgi:transcriptional regulator with XRE-family HTH domain
VLQRKLGKRIASLRKAKKLTQEQLAEALDCYGVLSLDPEEGLVLSAKNLQDCTPEEFLNTFLQKTEVSKIIHGRDENNCEVTLFGCSGKLTSQIGLDSYRIRPLPKIGLRGSLYTGDK